MPMSGYLEQIRRKVGHDLLLLPSASVAIHNDQLGLQVTDPSGLQVPSLTFPSSILSGGNIQVPQPGK